MLPTLLVGGWSLVSRGVVHYLPTSGGRYGQSYSVLGKVPVDDRLRFSGARDESYTIRSAICSLLALPSYTFLVFV